MGQVKTKMGRGAFMVWTKMLHLDFGARKILCSDLAILTDQHYVVKMELESTPNLDFSS